MLVSFSVCHVTHSSALYLCILAPLLGDCSSMFDLGGYVHAGGHVQCDALPVQEGAAAACPPVTSEGGDRALREALAMAGAAMAAKNRWAEEMEGRAEGAAAEAKAARRALEAAEEDVGFLRAQMENVLGEKARLGHEHAALTRECANLRLERGILRSQVEEFAEVHAWPTWV